MAITTDNTVYHDDFTTSNVESKNYLRILFKAGYSVQVRELNQMQSILQSQIDKFGQSVWKDGAAVIGGNCTYDQTVQYIDGTVTTNPNVNVSTAILDAKTINEFGGLTANILGVKSLGGTSYRLFLRYNNSATDGTTAAYSVSNVLSTGNDLAVAVSAVGFAAGIFLSKGVFFTKGSFVATDAQSTFFTLDNQDASVNGKACLYVSEAFVDYTTDISLTDNANGTPNYSAPGADRYAVDLTLAFESEGTSNATSKITLLTIVNSVPTLALRDRYSDLDRQLAQRTYEESGNYTVNPFKTHLRELYNNGSNYGRYLSTELYKAGYSVTDGDLPASIASAQERYSLGVDSSVGYVYGYRVAPLDKTELNAPKARTLSALTPANTYANIGNYVIGSFGSGSYLPIIKNITDTYNVGLTKTSSGWSSGSSSITLNNVIGLTVGCIVSGTDIGSSRTILSIDSSTAITLSSAPSGANSGTLNFSAGTTKIKGVEVENGSTYRMYLYDTIITASGGFNLSDIANIWSTGGTPVKFTVATGGSLAFASNDTAVFKLPFDAVSELTNIKYNILYTTSGTVTSTTTIALNVTSGQQAFSDLTPGNIILFIAGVKTDVTSISGVSLDSSSITLNFNTVSSTAAYTVIIPVNVGGNDGDGVMIKALTSQTDTITASSGQTVFTLSKAEVFALTSVTIGGNNTTSDWIISDDGQRDDYVTNVKLKYIGKKSFTSESVAFVYTYFARSGSSICASVNSYWPSATNSSAGLTYSTIPSYNGSRLADCIDFRPVILSGVTGTVADQLNPYSIISANARFYLPRVDKLSVDQNGNFTITQGQPQLNARDPETPPKSMALYTFDIPAYTHSTADIVTHYIDNRRYTMRDIGGLENRIKNIEYYTTLSLLEKSANDKPIFDSGGSRFKNGILVDSFYNNNTANIASEAYSASIDSVKGTLRPQYSTRRFDFKKVNDSLSGIAINSNTATLAYTQTPLISQSYATESESVNPYDVASFVGVVTLTPGSDEWKEVTDTTVYAALDTSNYDAVKDTAVLGTVWNEWTTNWTGTPKTTKSAKHSVVNPATGGKVQAITTSALTLQSRTGLETQLNFADISQNTGDRVVDVTFIPFIRSRKVYFSASGLKPNTTVYPFFDGVDISAYAMPLTSIVNYKDSTEVKTYNGTTYIPSGNTSTLSAGLSAGITAAPLKTNVAGELTGVFLIPNNAAYKFKTGSRAFRLIDSVRNLLSEATTYADSNYVANGLTETHETLITSTRIPQLTQTRVDQSQTVNKVLSIKYKDPLAQSFVIGDIETGAFVTSVDLYFQSTSATLPVTVEIVTVENGVPTQKVVPFSQVSLNPYTIDGSGAYTTTRVVQVSTTTNGVTTTPATRFTFSDPVYLKAGAEYAIVVKSNDPAYRMYVARVGGTDITTGQKITKNVYAGVMFMSQNASTWTPDQTRDFKFVLNRAEFVASGSLQFKPTFSTGVESVTVNNGGSGFTQNSASVTFSAPGGTGNTTATGTPTVDILTGSITKVTVTNPGSGYTNGSPPTLTFAQSGGSPTQPNTTVSLLNVPVTTFNLAQENITVEGTSIVNTLQLGTAITAVVSPAENYDLKKAFAFDLSTAPNTSMTTALSTNSNYVSPVVDLDRVSLLTVKNQINALADNDTTETTADKGAAAARYITKTVNLNNPADQLNIYVDVNRPTAASQIILYAKLAYNAANATPTTWVKVSPVNAIPVSSNSEEYTEAEYTLASPANDFISFTIKIVFSSDNLYDVPSVRNFRAIATTGV
jgi:hypothetical protein